MKIRYNCLKKASGSLALILFSLNYNASLYAMPSLISSEIPNSGKIPKPNYQNALGTFYVDFNSSAISVNNFVDQLKEYFEFDKDHSFELVNENYNVKTGFKHYSYQHFYKNVKVNGDMLFIHSKDGIVKQINGQIVHFKNIDISTTINEAKINDIALSNFSTTKNVKIGAIETFIFKQEKSENTVDVRLVNKVNVTATLPLKSIDFIIDAQTGEILSQRNKLYKADVQSTSATYNRGNKSLTVDSYNGNYRLRDNARKIRTFNAIDLDGDLNSDGTFSGYKEYTSTTANFTSNATKPAVEVHWGMQKTYDYYKNVHNRNSFDANGHFINNYYDIGNFVGDDENAFAVDGNDGVDVYLGMFYGKGGGLMHPVVNLDVAGHEFSHLVISRNGNGGLDYENESGALNESFADMFGTAIEFYVNDSPNWTIGEGIFKSNVTPNYFRNLANPNHAAQNFTPRQPDTYKGTYWVPTTNNPNDWNDNGGVHTNSGVGNFWFYLLCQGGSGQNDIGNNYYVDGITIQKAEKIVYQALMTGLTNSATYLDAFNATKQAATTLYGTGSNEWNQVVNAWYAVGIGNAPASNVNFEMQLKLKVYPNPVSGDEVTIESSLEEDAFVEMYDIQGKLVMKSVNLNNRLVVNVSNYASGIYLLKFKSKAGEYSHKLVIK